MALPPPEPLGKNALRIEGLRRAVIAAALRMFAERGYDATTMDDIAAAAGVSRRSLFRYFAGKDDIAFAAIDQNEAEYLRARLAQDGSGRPPAARLKSAFVALARRPESDAADLRGKIRLIFDTPALASRMHDEIGGWEAQFDELLARPGGGGDFARKVQVAAITAAYIAAVRSWAASGDRPIGDWVADAFAALEGVAGE